MFIYCVFAANLLHVYWYIARCLLVLCCSFAGALLLLFITILLRVYYNILRQLTELKLKLKIYNENHKMFVVTENTNLLKFVQQTQTLLREKQVILRKRRSFWNILPRICSTFYYEFAALLNLLDILLRICCTFDRSLLPIWCLIYCNRDVSVIVYLPSGLVHLWPQMIPLCCTFNARLTASLTQSFLLDWCTIYCLFNMILTAKLMHLFLHCRCEVYYKCDMRFIRNIMWDLLQIWREFYYKFDASFTTNLTCDLLKIWRKLYCKFDKIFTTN
jgi:hypothetical protein